MEAHPTWLTDFLWIAFSATSVVFIFQKLRIPDVIGLMITGILLGPTGFQVLQNPEAIQVAAELGVILLLFTIGLEFSLNDLKRLRVIAGVGGTLQLLITTFALTGLAFWIFQLIGVGPLSFKQALTLGIIGSLSSTAIALKVLSGRNELLAPHGQIALGILLWQDMAIVVLLWILAFLSASGEGPSSLSQIPITFGLLALVFAGFYFLLPKLGHFVFYLRSKEILILASLLICFGAATLTESLGLSGPLGAFLAGMIIAGTDYGSKMEHTVEPFRDTLTSLFFVSIGILLNVEANQLPFFALSALGVTILKASVIFIICKFLGFSSRVSILAGLCLAQIGEFSFVLALSALKSDLVSPDTYQRILGTIVFTQILAPFLITVAPRVADTLIEFPVPKKLKLLGLLKWNSSLLSAPPQETLDQYDLLVIGFGTSGQNIYNVTLRSALHSRVLEMNRNLVSFFLKKGVDIHYGDATDKKRLKQLGADLPKVIVVTISDSKALNSIVTTLRSINPSAKILVRTRYLKEATPIYRSGADVVFVEESETSIQIVSKVLDIFGFEPKWIQEQETLTRQDQDSVFIPR